MRRQAALNDLRSLLALALVLLLGAGAGGCGGGAPGGVVANLDGRPITRSALDHWTALERAAGQRSSGSAARAALGLVGFGGRIVGEAAELGVKLSASEVEEQLSVFADDRTLGAQYEPIAQEAPFVHLLGAPGQSRSDQLWLMRMNMLRLGIEHALSRIAQRSIPRAQVATFYAEHKQRFVLPERIDMEILGSNDERTVKKAKREIEAGADFIGVAKRVSSDPEAPEGLQSFAKGHEEVPFERVVFAAKPGVLTGPEKYRLYYIFRVIRFTPSRQLTLAQAEGAIRRRIVESRGAQQAKTLRALDQRSARATACRGGAAAEACKALTDPAR